MSEQDGVNSSAPEAQPSLLLEDIVEASVGQMNFSQAMQAILTSIPTCFDSQQTFISVFVDAQPAWHCTNVKGCFSSDLCSLSKSDWAWNGNAHNTIISEWGLECASAFIKGLPATSFFLGCLLGGFVLPPLGDSFLGRKNLVFLSCLIMSIVAFASAFSPNIWIYSTFRFISGIGRVSILNSTLILLSEKAGKRWRGHVMMLGLLFMDSGLLSLTGIAYLLRNSSWRALYLWTSIPGILYCILGHFVVYESPRWLLMRGRGTDAIAVLKQIGSVDHINLGSLNSHITPGVNKYRNPYSSIKLLVKRRWAIVRTLACVALRFGAALMFFGVFYGVGDLGFNVYLMTTINVLIALTCSMITYLFWIQRCNRRTSVVGFCAVSGAVSILSITAGQHHKTVAAIMAFVSFFCTCMARDILLIYVVEMFPTCIRSSATAMSRQSLLLASVFVPVLVVIGKRNELFSRGVFGVSILLSGFLALCLPETKGKPLCDTMEEQELTDKAGGCLSKI